MKLRSIILVAACTLWTGGPIAQVAPQLTVAGRPALWFVHFDAERLRTGAGQELFASLDPILTSLSGDKSSSPGGKLESPAIGGFQPQNDGGDPIPFLADIRFSSEGGGISQRFEAVSKKHEGGAVWISKFNEGRLLVGTSRGLLEWARAPGTGGVAAVLPQKPNEMLGGNVEIRPLLATNPLLRDSELLKLLPHLEFHIPRCKRRSPRRRPTRTKRLRSGRSTPGEPQHQAVQPCQGATPGGRFTGVPPLQGPRVTSNWMHIIAIFHLPRMAFRLSGDERRRLLNGAASSWKVSATKPRVRSVFE